MAAPVERAATCLTGPAFKPPRVTRASNTKSKNDRTNMTMLKPCHNCKTLQNNEIQN